VTDTIGDLPGWNEHCGERDGVRVQHPRQSRSRRVAEGGLDVGKGHEQKGRVEVGRQRGEPGDGENHACAALVFGDRGTRRGTVVPVV